VTGQTNTDSDSCRPASTQAHVWGEMAREDSPTVTDAVSARSCDICGAPKGVLCTNPIRPGQPLPGRIIHIGRKEPR